LVSHQPAIQKRTGPTCCREQALGNLWLTRKMQMRIEGENIAPHETILSG